MKITDILTADVIVPQLNGRNKQEVLRELSQCLVDKYPEIKLDQLLSVLSERERLGSTAIGDSIAIPHGKLPGVMKIVGAFGRHPTGVDFESLDGNPTQLFFLLVAPENSASLHLKALARVSRLLKSESFRRKLIDAADATRIFRLIKEEDAKY